MTAPNENNAKSDYTQLPKSSDHGEILKQVEFYFSDNNLPYDKFLWTETSKNDGWIPIKTIHSFKRMRHFEPFEEVVAALRTSPELLEVSENGEKVRRKTEIKVPAAQESKSRFGRTVYAKGFGDETSTSQVDIEAFFANICPVNQVRLRRTDDGTFKSSVFVEFKNLEDAEMFVKQDPKPKFGENELVVMSKQAYVEMKSEQHNFSDRANGRKKPKFNAFKEMRNKESRVKKNLRGNKRENYKRKSREEPDSEPKKAKVDDTNETGEVEQPKEAEPAKDAQEAPQETFKKAN